MGRVIQAKTPELSNPIQSNLDQTLNRLKCSIK